MKGKGKRKSKVKPSSKDKISIFDEFTKEPEFITANVVQNCPRYVTVMQRRGRKRVSYVDLKPLQFELEHILLYAVKRKQQLQNEIEKILSRNGESINKPAPVVRKISDSKPSKKARPSLSKAAITRIKNKSTPILKLPEIDFSETVVDLPKPPKSDGPSRFWNFIEPYCADITQEHLRVVEEWMCSSQKHSPAKQIPARREHFTEKWPLEDIDEEVIEGSRTVDNPAGLSKEQLMNSETERILKLGEKNCQELSNQHGSNLSDRIVSRLIQENLMTSMDDSMADAYNDEPCTRLRQPVHSLSDEDLENRLRKDLCEIGALSENEDWFRMSAEDRVSQELELLHRQLEPLQESNCRKKKQLLHLGKKTMQHQDMRRKLRHINVKVQETFRAVSAATWSGKKLPKKLEEQAIKLLNERDQLVETLYVMDNATQSR